MIHWITRDGARHCSQIFYVQSAPHFREDHSIIGAIVIFRKYQILGVVQSLNVCDPVRLALAHIRHSF